MIHKVGDVSVMFILGYVGGLPLIGRDSGVGGVVRIFINFTLTKE